MSATQDGKNWFVLRKGKRSGPHTIAALVRAVERGGVGPEAGIWCVGWAEWRIARDVPELFGQEPEPDLEKDVDAPEKVPEGPVDTADHIREVAAESDEAPALVLLASQPNHQQTDLGGGVGRRVMISVLSVLAVLVIVFGAGWVATSMGIIRVEFIPLR